MRQTARCCSAALCAVSFITGATGIAQERGKHVVADIISGSIKRPQITVGVAPNTRPVIRRLPFISPGRLKAAEVINRLRLERGEELSSGAGSPNAFPEAGSGTRNTIGCSNRTSNGNVRVNQDCTYRQQAEESIVYNPANPNNLIAGLNDRRVGWNQCAIAWSIDDGTHWGDLLPPFRQRINGPESEAPTPDDPNSHTIIGGPGTSHTYDAESDPAAAFDSQGRGFFTCVTFDIFTNAGMVYATQSPIAARGSFFYNIDPAGRNFIIDEENDLRAILDKPFITADTFAESPNRDTVYATWTVFNFSCGASGSDFCSSTIFGSVSTDHGLTWSTPEEISGSSRTLCFFGDAFDARRSPHSCDFDQAPDLASQPNGDLVVIFVNGNTPANDPNNQYLNVVCNPSGSSPGGTARLNCGSPVKVGDDILVNEPQCDFGTCVPGPYVRTEDFPRIAVNRLNGHLFATWQDYRHGEYDIQLATSTDGGHTWSSSSRVNSDSGLDHYMPAVAVAHSRWDRVGVSYYRSQRVPNENSTPAGGFVPGDRGVQQGSSDYVLAGGRGVKTPFRFKVVSPEFPPPDGNQIGFNGDYSGLTINRGEEEEIEAHPIWSDTRNTNPFPLNGSIHDEDIFTSILDLP